MTEFSINWWWLGASFLWEIMNQGSSINLEGKNVIFKTALLKRTFDSLMEAVFSPLNIHTFIENYTVFGGYIETLYP